MLLFTTYLGIELMQNIFEVISLDGLLRIEQIKEPLHKLGCYVDFEGADLNLLVDDKLQEKLIDTLNVGPGRIHLLLLVGDTSLSEVQVVLLDTWQRSEDVLFNHLHDFIQVLKNDARQSFLVLNHLKELLNGVEAFSLSLLILRLSFPVVNTRANLQFFNKLILVVFT